MSPSTLRNLNKREKSDATGEEDAREDLSDYVPVLVLQPFRNTTSSAR